MSPSVAYCSICRAIFEVKPDIFPLMQGMSIDDILRWPFILKIVSDFQLDACFRVNEL